MALIELMDRVDGPEAFLEFARALIADRVAEAGEPVDQLGRGVRGWENHTIESFLDAAVSWADATKLGETQGLGNVSPWKRFAAFLYCGKIYE